MNTRIADANNFLDINGLNDIRLQSKAEDKGEKKQALEKVAKQFEGIFMQMLLKSMRSAEDVLATDSPFNSQSTRFYRDMHDQQLAVELSQNGSLGLAPLIVRQLGGDRENFTPHSVIRSDANAGLSQLSGVVDSAVSAKKNSVDTELSMPFRPHNTLQTPQFEQPHDFVTALTEPAKAVQQQLGVPYEVVIAQAALETGWGQKIIKAADGSSSNNLFNIKADGRWQGQRANKETLEFEQGAMVKKTAPFRVYQSLRDSVNDYIDFLSSNDRYQDALQHDGNVEHFLQSLKDAGYATDPDYVNKILGTLSKVTSLLKN